MLCLECGEHIPTCYSKRTRHPKCQTVYDVRQRLLAATGQEEARPDDAPTETYKPEWSWVDAYRHERRFYENSHWSTKPYKNRENFGFTEMKRRGVK